MLHFIESAVEVVSLYILLLAIQIILDRLTGWQLYEMFVSEDKKD